MNATDTALSHAERRVLNTIRFCSNCGEQPADGLFRARRYAESGSERTTPYRGFLCGNCADSDRFEDVRRERGVPLLTSEQEAVLDRWVTWLQAIGEW